MRGKFGRDWASDELKKVMLLVNDTTYAYNLRGEVIRSFAARKIEVVVVCELLLLQEELEALGCRVIGVQIGRHGTNPVQDLKLLKQYISILLKEKPDTVLTYNIKPNIYGGMACRMLGIRYMPNITGLGTAVEIPGKMQILTTKLYKWGVAGAECVFFQNLENKRFFQSRKMMGKRSRICLLPGSGVNLEKHKVKLYPQGNRINFLYVARVMKEKGIDLYLTAAKIIHEKYPYTVFHVCGMCDDPDYLDILKKEEKNGYIKYHGQQRDMAPFFEKAHCIVHPSYYPEGMSNVLLEAAASARPIIATDRAGCRETVDDGITGFVVPIKDETALITAIEKFINMSWQQRRDMGLAGRRKMEKEFDRAIVVEKVVNEVAKRRKM